MAWSAVVTPDSDEKFRGNLRVCHSILVCDVRARWERTKREKGETNRKKEGESLVSNYTQGTDFNNNCFFLFFFFFFFSFLCFVSRKFSLPLNT